MPNDNQMFQIKFNQLNETQRDIIKLLNENFGTEITSKQIAKELKYNPQYITQTLSRLKKDLKCPIVLIRKRGKALYKLMRKIEIILEY